MCVQLKLLSAEVLDLELLFSTNDNSDAGPSDEAATLPTAPVVTYQPGSMEYYNIPVPIDVMCMLSLTTPFQSVYDMICEGISLQLEQIEKYVLWKVRVILNNSLNSSNSLNTVVKVKYFIKYVNNSLNTTVKMK